MKTSWNETRLIDRKLNGTLSPQENLLHAAKQLAQPDYAQAVLWQQNVYPLIETYGQNKLRAEMDEVFDELMNKPPYRSFRVTILNFFTRR